MTFRSSLKIIFPIAIVTTIVVASVAPKKLSFDNLSATVNQPTELTQSENSKKIAKNPTPESIQVLGEKDIKISNTQTIDSSNQFDPQVLYGLINSYRRDNGLSNFLINQSLEESARRKINDMIKNEYYRHADTNNNESWYLFQASGYQYKFAGENLSFGHNTPWQVFEAWQQSSQHNEQLLKSEYREMGLAINCEEYKVGREPSCVVVLHLGAR